ncbi:MAG: Dihydrolipoyl dehydrogenase [Chlamydiae bacterium]|nr:Dihydrolipoyl dehydrogenase [Chlamydiota bacterium]
MEKEFYDCLVLGSGPGGYVAAIRAAQRGLKTALIEVRELGGTCLNRGCIPSKALISNADVLRKVREAQKFGISVGDISFDYKAMKNRKDEVVGKIRKGLTSLIASNKIRVYEGYGKFLSPHEIKVTGGKEEAVLEGKTIILATGSEPRALPNMPFDYERIHDSTSLLNITELPKKILIIGGGIIGCEFACLHHAFGVEVTILELLPTILPTEGKHVAEALSSSFKKRGIQIETECLIENIQRTDGGVVANLQDGRKIEADRALVSVGRKFNTDTIGIEKTGVALNPNGTVPTNQYLQTTVPHIFAIGDITGKWLLAHVASHQGMIAADNAAGKREEIHYNAVPSVIFTDPEIGTIGYTLEEAIQEGWEVTLGKFPFQALGKAQATMETEGFAQIVTEKTTGQILGAQVMGYGAATLIAEMAVAISNELTVYSISETIHAHPTIAEAWMEAAFIATDMPIHMPPEGKS